VHRLVVDLIASRMGRSMASARIDTGTVTCIRVRANVTVSVCAALSLATQASTSMATNMEPAR
jgi:hypothetical protein